MHLCAMVAAVCMNAEGLLQQDDRVALGCGMNRPATLEGRLADLIARMVVCNGGYRHDSTWECPCIWCPVLNAKDAIRLSMMKCFSELMHHYTGCAT